MFTAIYRLIKFGLQTFWRQRLLTVATMVVIVLALLVFQGLILTGVTLGTLLQSLQDKIDIAVFFEVNTPEDEILRVKRSLEELSEVEEVTYVSRDEALLMFRERHAGEEEYELALELLDENPLQASLNIRAENPDQYEVVDAFLQGAISPDLVDKVTFNDTREVIENLSLMIRVSRQAGAIVAIFLTIVAILVSFNTILLGIYSNRDEISIMRLVGASNLYVRGPFIVIGVIYGVMAAIIGMLITAPIILISSDVVRLLIPEMNLVEYFTSNFLTLFLYQLLFGVGIGVVSSFIAIRRYLKI